MQFVSLQTQCFKRFPRVYAYIIQLIGSLNELCLLMNNIAKINRKIIIIEHLIIVFGNGPEVAAFGVSDTNTDEKYSCKQEYSRSWEGWTE